MENKERKNSFALSKEKRIGFIRRMVKSIADSFFTEPTPENVRRIMSRGRGFGAKDSRNS